MSIAELDSDTFEDTQNENTQEAANADGMEMHIVEAAGAIRAEYVALQVHRSGVPMRQKTFSDKQKEKAASMFGACGGAVSMSKKLFNAKIPEVKNFRAVLAEVNKLVNDPTYTLPCPGEPGVRLLKRGMISSVDGRLTRLQQRLKDSAEALSAAMPMIRRQMERELQELYSAEDFDFDVNDVKLEWSFPAKGVVSDALRVICPEAYTRELQRTKEFYESACKAREEEVAVGMYQMLDTLLFAIQGSGDKSKRRVFKDATVTKIFNALDLAEQQRQELKIGEGPVKEAFDALRSTLDGRREGLPERLRRGSDQFRKQLGEQIAAVGENLLASAVSPKRRVILRKKARVLTD